MNNKPFKFRSEDYSKYRPGYPKQIFEYLSFITNENYRAWDCATGNGQAAIGLAPYFKEVIATDLSKHQIANCKPLRNIRYYQATAENSKIASNSVDLITVATAIHWFDLKKFFSEVKRVLKPNGILAVWNYTNFTNINPEINKILDDFNINLLGKKYWPIQAYKIFTEGYTFKFPFRKINPPKIIMEKSWTFDDFIKYLHTWSGVQVYMKKNKKDPIEFIYDDLRTQWGRTNRKRKLQWKLLFRVCRV